MIKWNEKWGMWEVLVLIHFRFLTSVYRDAFFWVKYKEDIDWAFAVDYFNETYGTLG